MKLRPSRVHRRGAGARWVSSIAATRRHRSSHGAARAPPEPQRKPEARCAHLGGQINVGAPIFTQYTPRATHLGPPSSTAVRVLIYYRGLSLSTPLRYPVPGLRVEMRESTSPKSQPKSPKPPPRSPKSPDHQRVHHTRWWGSPRRKQSSQAADHMSRPLWEGSPDLRPISLRMRAPSKEGWKPPLHLRRRLETCAGSRHVRARDKCGLQACAEQARHVRACGDRRAGAPEGLRRCRSPQISRLELDAPRGTCARARDGRTTACRRHK